MCGAQVLQQPHYMQRHGRQHPCKPIQPFRARCTCCAAHRPSAAAHLEVGARRHEHRNNAGHQLVAEVEQKRRARHHQHERGAQKRARQTGRGAAGCSHGNAAQARDADRNLGARCERRCRECCCCAAAPYRAQDHLDRLLHLLDSPETREVPQGARGGWPEKNQMVVWADRPLAASEKATNIVRVK